MSLFFNPKGVFDIATNPSDLPQTNDQYNVSSDSMQRCKNLRRDQDGQLQVRDGGSILNSTAISTPIWHIREQEGTRYGFGDTIIYEDESSIATSLTSARWSSIAYNSYNSTTQNVFALNGTDRKRIEGSSVYEWGIAAPEDAPTIVVDVADNTLTGTYNAKYTYARLEGATVVSESDPSPAATDGVALVSQTLKVTWDVSSDSQVTHVGIYRTLSDGAIYYLDSYVTVISTAHESKKVDAALGTEVATDHDRPPLGSYVAGPNFNGTCFIIKDNLLYFSKAKQPEYWPVANFVEVSTPQFPGQVMVFHNGQPYYLTKNKIYFIQGTGSNTFFPYKMEAITGAQGVLGAESVQGKGIFHVGSDGVYLYSGGGDDRNITKETLQPIFRGETVNGVPGAGDLGNAWLKQFKDLLYFGYPGVGETYPTNVIVWDLTTNKSAYYSWGTDEIASITVDETNDRLLVGDQDGYVWHLEDSTKTDDDGTDISWEVESKNYTLSTRRHFPRFIRYDVDVESGSEATGDILLDGTSIQSHTLSGSRLTKKRLVDSNNGRRCSLKVSGSGPATIYPMEME